MRAPFQSGDFPAPVKYGYCNVGVVEQGPAELVGRSVFCLYPHQTRYVVPAAALRVLPDDVPPARAVLAANLETAVNALWDAAPRVGDRVAVIGAGTVGCLTAWLAARIAGAEVELIDVDERKAAAAQRARRARFAHRPRRELTSTSSCIRAAPPPASRPRSRSRASKRPCVELSWYGDDAPAVPLGAAFHSRRLTLKSSQVGAVASAQRARWTHAAALRARAEACSRTRSSMRSSRREPVRRAAGRARANWRPRAGTLSPTASSTDRNRSMFIVSVRDHFMIAHSFTGKVFGPAQKLHGATYVVDVEFRRAELDPDGIVVDIGRASDGLREVLSALNFRNLDDEPAFRGTQHDDGVSRVRDPRAHRRARSRPASFGPHAHGLASLRVTLHESHVAWAAYEGAAAGALMTTRAIDFVVPGDITTPTGGYIYDREIIAGLTERGLRTELHSLDASFPHPTPAALRAARAMFAGLAAGSVVVIDGLALPGLDRLLADEARRLALVALVHHPVALETGLDPLEAERFAALERRALVVRATRDHDEPMDGAHARLPKASRSVSCGSSSPASTVARRAAARTRNRALAMRPSTTC